MFRGEKRSFEKIKICLYPLIECKKSNSELFYLNHPLKTHRVYGCPTRSTHYSIIICENNNESFWCDQSRKHQIYPWMNAHFALLNVMEILIVASWSWISSFSLAEDKIFQLHLLAFTVNCIVVWPCGNTWSSSRYSCSALSVFWLWEQQSQWEIETPLSPAFEEGLHPYLTPANSTLRSTFLSARWIIFFLG